MAAVCASCHDPLILTLDASDDSDDDVRMQEDDAGPSNPSQNSTAVPDDVHLRACGCHFHWQCLLDAYSLNSCPSCGANITTESSSGGQQQVLCNLNNEGGLEENLDILPLLVEECYLKAYPEERRACAFLEFCRTGDLPAIVELLKSPDDDEDDDDFSDLDDEEEKAASALPTDRIDVLRFQDPFGSMQTGLHAAITARSREVAWLMLLLASRLDLMQFPAAVYQEAAALGVMRDDAEVAAKPDIRGFKDAHGRTAADIAREVGTPWGEWLEKGWLTL